MTGPRRSVASAIRDALLTGEAKAKVFAARQVARDWRLGRLDFVFEVTMPDLSLIHISEPTRPY